MRDTPIRAIFCGTPAFSVGILQALVSCHIDIVAVYSQPVRKSGRGMKSTPSPVQAHAETLGIPVYTPQSFKVHADQQAFVDRCAEQAVDVAVVVAYGLILPQCILAAPRLGCVNVHASILPRWRGAAPIQRAIEAGDTQTGITFMKMDLGLDTGDILRIAACPILPDDTGADLHDRLATLGANGIAAVVEDLAAGVITPTPQPSTGVRYAHKLQKLDGLVDWSMPANAVHARQRAFTPWPGAFTHLTLKDRITRLKICQAQVNNEHDHGQPPGTVLDDKMTIACGGYSSLTILHLQKPGKATMDTAAFLRGNTVPVGAKLE